MLEGKRSYIFNNLGIRINGVMKAAERGKGILPQTLIFYKGPVIPNFNFF